MAQTIRHVAMSQRTSGDVLEQRSTGSPAPICALGHIGLCLSRRYMMARL